MYKILLSLIFAGGTFATWAQDKPSGKQVNALPKKIEHREIGDEDKIFTNLGEALKKPNLVYHLALQNLAIVPTQIGQFKNLRTLSLTKGKIVVLPGILGELGTLESLDLSHNQIQNLPDLSKLKKLKNLNLANNQIQNLPDYFGHLPTLERLDLSYNLFSEVPRAIDELKTLQEWHILGNPIPNLVFNTWDLQNIKTFGSMEEALKTPEEVIKLQLSGLSQIPAEITQFTNLQSLHVENNHINELPAEIGQLKNLQELNLSGNYLQSLPAEIGELTILKQLDLSLNPLKDLPAEIGNLKQLEH